LILLDARLRGHDMNGRVAIPNIVIARLDRAIQ